jgi:aryl-alcohol dehydrogenase-like predicted oxidoreductase
MASGKTQEDDMSRDRSDLNRRSLFKAGVGLAVGAAVGKTVAPARPAEAAAGTGLRTSKLPRGGAEVPIFFCGSGPLIVGGANFAGLKLTNEDKIELFRYAYDQGLRYFDTAASYGTEPLIGAALKDVLDEVYIGTKTHAALGDGDLAKLTREHVEASRKNLGRDVLDCVKMHNPVELDKALVVLDELERLRDEGRIRNIGVSCHVPFETAYRLIDTGRLDEALLARCYFPKGLYELISHRNREFQQLAIARAHELGMNLIGMKALGAGVFSRSTKVLVPEYDPDRARLIPAAAIRWSYSDPRFHGYAIGVTRPSDIDENIATCSGDMSLSNEDRLLLADYSTHAWDAEMIRALPELYKYPGYTTEQATADLGMTQEEQQAAIGRWFKERIW